MRAAFVALAAAALVLSSIAAAQECQLDLPLAANASVCARGAFRVIKPLPAGPYSASCAARAPVTGSLRVHYPPSESAARGRGGSLAPWPACSGPCEHSAHCAAPIPHTPYGTTCTAAMCCPHAVDGSCNPAVLSTSNANASRSLRAAYLTTPAPREQRSALRTAHPHARPANGHSLHVHACARRAVCAVARWAGLSG